MPPLRAELQLYFTAMRNPPVLSLGESGLLGDIDHRHRLPAPLCFFLQSWSELAPVIHKGQGCHELRLRQRPVANLPVDDERSTSFNAPCEHHVLLAGELLQVGVVG